MYIHKFEKFFAAPHKILAAHQIARHWCKESPYHQLSWGYLTKGISGRSDRNNDSLIVVFFCYLKTNPHFSFHSSAKILLGTFICIFMNLKSNHVAARTFWFRAAHNSSFSAVSIIRFRLVDNRNTHKLEAFFRIDVLLLGAC